uniref:hypothetical protein n=1 Tax=Neisseria sicca TaxID=490 RepID=UPI001649ED70
MFEDLGDLLVGEREVFIEGVNGGGGLGGLLEGLISDVVFGLIDVEWVGGFGNVLVKAGLVVLRGSLG